MISRRQFIKSSVTTALVAGLPLRAAAQDVHIETGAAFGSTWRLVLASKRDARAARRVISAVVERIDARMSPFRLTSELALFNRSKVGEMRQTLSADSAHVLASALELARISDGAFDPTSAPISRRFGFGPLVIAPDRPAGRYGDIKLRGLEITCQTFGLSLDLCAIAKGYALDEMVRALDGADFLLELGGEIAARGRHPSGRAWRMGIERPGSKILQRIIDAGDDVLATSANAEEGYRLFKRQYGHVVDPRTAQPVDNGVASVSVLAPSGEMADGLATAALVMGPEKARPLLKAYGARALFLLGHGTAMKEVDVFGFSEGRNG